jgi:hypothetical protein
VHRIRTQLTILAAILIVLGTAVAASARGNGKGRFGTNGGVVTTTTTTTAPAGPTTGATTTTTTTSGPTTTADPTTTTSVPQTTSPTPPPPVAPTTVAPTPSSGSGFVQKFGTALALNGQPFRFDGTNIYDVNSDGGCVPATDPNSDLNALPGQEAFRAYFFQEWTTSGSTRDWSRMDATLAAATAHGEKVIAVLANEWNYCDGPQKYLPWWQSGYQTTIDPGDLTPYRQWVHDIVSRYASSPAIGMWQLVNEGEARNSDGSCSESTAASALLNFSNDVGGMVHALDPNHLVSLGPISGECGTNEGDYQTVYSSAGTDVCDYHDYGFPTSPGGNTDPYNGLGATISRCHAAGKPIMVGEMGIHWTKLSNPTLDQRAIDFDAKFSWQFSNGVVGSLMWDYSPSPSAQWDYEIGPSDPSAKLLTKY